MSKKFTKLNLDEIVSSTNGKSFRKLSTTTSKVENYLTFSSPNLFTINIIDNKKHWDGTLEYSTDTSTWNEWDGTNAISSSEDGNLYMRGLGNTYITGSSASSSAGYWVLNGDNISCNGNIENLLDYQIVANNEHPTMANKCYFQMFKDCIALTTAPELPATTLTSNCYQGMFQNCTSLITAPELPATTLTSSCYQGMFSGCKALTTIPKLPATTLTMKCYMTMFNGCILIKLSKDKTEEYHTEYRIPKNGTGTTATMALQYMFNGTSGTFTGTPEINTTYYTSNTVV